MLSSKHVRVFRKTCTTFLENTYVFFKRLLLPLPYGKDETILRIRGVPSGSYSTIQGSEDLHQRRLHLPEPRRV